MVMKKQNGIRYRIFLRMYLYKGADILFNTYEEYKYINKFGKGAWDRKIRNSFNKEEQDTIVDIANGYGAFDY